MASLVSEVATHVLYNHTFKSAEQTLYDHKMVYSTPSLGNVGSSCDASTSGKTGSNEEVVILRKEVAELKLKSERMQQEIETLRVQLQQFRDSHLKCFAFFALGANILVLGDGNLSFSMALATRFPNKRIVASVLETREVFISRYHTGAKTLQKIQSFSDNVVLRFGIDATRIHLIPEFMKETFTDVIMNFPHHCGKTNLRRSRALIMGIFRSVSRVLMKTNMTKLHITLAKGQSGLNVEEVRSLVEHFSAAVRLPYYQPDSWQVVFLAAECGLRLDEAKIFCPNQFPGYVCAGYLNKEQSFHNENAAITLTFVKAYDAVSTEAKTAEIDFNEAKHIESRHPPLPLLSGNQGGKPENAAGGNKKVEKVDEDFDLFGSDDDDEESEQQKRIREERLAAYAAKKLKKPGPIAKSSVVLDIQPWDDETDMKKVEERVRSIVKDGLNWGASKMIPIGYGIEKLQIVLTIEDEKISVDVDLVERIQEEYSDFVQSVDIVAFNKI